MTAFVLDASGLLAYLLDEDGAAVVTDALAQGATIGAANLGEALSKLSEQGVAPRELVTDLEERGILGGLIGVEPLTAEDAVLIAELRPPTREHGLGLGDRACLALGLRLNLPVMTADRAWLELGSNVDVEVHSLRQ